MKIARLLPVLVAVINTAGVAHAQDLSWRAQVGAPDVAVVDGRAIAWRNVTMRAAAGAVSVETTLPVCSEGPLAARTLSSFERAGSGCVSSTGAPVLAPVGPEVEAKLRLPRLASSAPDVSVAVRRWSSSREWRGDGGAEVDVEASKGAGPLFFYAGHASPIATAHASEAWRATYAGVKLRPARRHVVELEIERETETRGGARAADLSLRYAYSGGPATRAKAYFTRASGTARDWRAGVGLDWNF